MTHYKTRAELVSKVIRISNAQYTLLTQLAIHAGVTISAALDLALKAVKPESKPEPESKPIPPALRVNVPVAKVYRLQPIIATNGSKSAVFRIKQGGIKYE